jgi:hypothetical protein
LAELAPRRPELAELSPRRPELERAPRRPEVAERALRGLGLAQRAHCLLALLAGRAIEDQNALEVIDLVLNDPRLEAGGLD